MQQIEKWRWKIRWGGRWTSTRIHYTEEQIRREHPEARKIQESRLVVDVPETPAEIAAAEQAMRRPPRNFTRE